MIDCVMKPAGIGGGRDAMVSNGQPDQMDTRSSPQVPESAEFAGAEKRAKHNLTARQRALRALQGSLADIPFSSDDFAAMKQEEIDREERTVARHS